MQPVLLIVQVSRTDLVNERILITTKPDGNKQHNLRCAVRCSLMFGTSKRIKKVLEHQVVDVQVCLS